MFKYNIIDHRFPDDLSDWDVCSYHLKEILVTKSIFGIKLYTRWYRQHINSEFGYWISVNSYDEDMMKWKTLPREIEEIQNKIYLDEFDDYHYRRTHRTFLHRVEILDDLLD